MKLSVFGAQSGKEIKAVLVPQNDKNHRVKHYSEGHLEAITV